MALLERKLLGNGTIISTWQVVETAEFFLNQLDLQAVEVQELSNLKGQRKLEWLASRYLIHEMLLAQGHADRIPVLKDSFGKPHIQGTPFHLSFSHSHQQVAVILSNRPCGIDIQFMVEKIDRLANKFLGEKEIASLDPANRMEHLHFYWSAKEAIYKAHGRKQLDFRTNIFIQPFGYQAFTSATGWILKNVERLEYELFFEEKPEYVLVWCEEITKRAEDGI